MKYMRIIPLLVFVSMLSFSVRLVDVVSGVSALSAGSAYAAKSEEKETKPEKEDKDDSKAESDGGLVFEDDEGKDKEKAKAKTAKKKKKGKKEKDIEWRDPNDEDPAYETFRVEMFDEIVARRKALEAKEKTLQTREALLKAAEQELDRKTQELAQLRQELENLLKTQSDEEQESIKSLVKIYEGMKPKQAARIFDTLDLDILVSVVGQMSERKLSPVLAAMNPERARTVTVILAEQKQLPELP